MRSREGKRTLGRGDWCDVLPGSAFHFRQSALCGMDAMSPSPPTSFPLCCGGCWFAKGTFVASLFSPLVLVLNELVLVLVIEKGASLFFSSAKPACWKGGRGRGESRDQGERKWSSVVWGRRSPAEDSKKRRRRVSGGDCCEDCSSRSARLAWQRRQPMVERWKLM